MWETWLLKIRIATDMLKVLGSKNHFGFIWNDGNRVQLTALESFPSLGGPL